MTKNNKNKCVISKTTSVIDDCHITIEFGYGSTSDFKTYIFTPVCDKIGKQIINYIQFMMPDGEKVEDFAEDTMDEYFGKKSSTPDQAKAEWGYDGI